MMKQTLWASVILASVAAMGCADEAPEGTLVLYSSRGEAFTNPVVEAFTEQTGIPVEVYSGKENELLLRLDREGDESEADLLLTKYAGTLKEASELGLFAALPASVSSTVPERYRGADWVGASARARVFVYNKDKLDEEEVGMLKNLMDLADPRWKGRLGITVSANSSFVGGTAAMIGQLGEDKTRAFLSGIKENAGQNVFPGHTPIVNAIAAGELDLGFVNHYYYYRHISNDANAPIGIIVPEQNAGGTPVTITGVAILKSSDQPELAARFLEFLFSNEGQKVYADLNFEFPVMPGVAAHELVQPLGELKFSPVNQTLQADNIDKARQLIREVGLQ